MSTYCGWYLVSNHSSLSFTNDFLHMVSVLYSRLLNICTDIVQCCWGMCCTLILYKCVFKPKCINVMSYWIKVMAGMAWGQCVKAVASACLPLSLLLVSKSLYICSALFSLTWSAGQLVCCGSVTLLQRLPLPLLSHIIHNSFNTQPRYWKGKL